MLHGSFILLMRSIREDALQQYAHLLRLMSVMILLTMFLVASRESAYEGIPGQTFLQQLSFLGVILITLAGIGHFSSSITEEKEEGTLGLLLLANVSPLAVLLGKSTNRIFSSLLLLATLFPFSLLALSLGGINSNQVINLFLALGAYLFLIANLALLVSVSVRRTSEAIILMTFLILLLHGVPELLNYLTRERFGQLPVRPPGMPQVVVDRLIDGHRQFSVVHATQQILDNPLSNTFPAWQVLGSLLCGLILFGLALWRFSAVIWAPEVSEPIQPRTINQSNRTIQIVSRPWTKAIAWKEFYFITGGPVLFLAKSVAYVVLIPLILFFRDPLESFFGVQIHHALQMGCVIFLTTEALLVSSQLFLIERRLGTLSTLLMVPQSLFRMTVQKIWGCLIGSFPTIAALLFVLGIDAQGHWTGWSETLLRFPVEQFFWIVVFGCAVLVMCQLTVLCSLYVSWGALPLAAALMAIVLIVAGPVLSGVIIVLKEHGQPTYANFGPVIYLTGLLSVGMTFETGRRLIALAGR